MSWSTSRRERAKLGMLDSELPLLRCEWPPGMCQRGKAEGEKEKDRDGYGRADGEAKECVILQNDHNERWIFWQSRGMCEEKQCKQGSSFYCDMRTIKEHLQRNRMAYLRGWTDRIALINTAFMQQWSQETAVRIEFASAARALISGSY